MTNVLSPRSERGPQVAQRADIWKTERTQDGTPLKSAQRPSAVEDERTFPHPGCEGAPAQQFRRVSPREPVGVHGHKLTG